MTNIYDRFTYTFQPHLSIKTSRIENRDILKELCDVLSATFGPHPGVCVEVKCGSHHMLLNLNSVLFTLVTVVMRHVEPGRKKNGIKCSIKLK